MQKILLLGDSIRIHYAPYVAKKLKGKAEVFSPRDNGMFTQFTLRMLHDWYRAVLKGELPDIVHFNNGLWDVLRLSNENNTFNDVDTYVKNLARIVERIIYLSPKAKIIFATTTPVIEPGFTPGIMVGNRKNEDIIKFNAAAKTMFDNKIFSNNLKISINNLYNIGLNLPTSVHSDDVHYDTELGNNKLSDAVVNSLFSYL